MWSTVKRNQSFPLFPIRNGERIDSLLRIFLCIPFSFAPGAQSSVRYLEGTPFCAAVPPKALRAEIYAGAGPDFAGPRPEDYRQFAAIETVGFRRGRYRPDDPARSRADGRDACALTRSGEVKADRPGFIDQGLDLRAVNGKLPYKRHVIRRRFSRNRHAVVPGDRNGITALARQFRSKPCIPSFPRKTAPNRRTFLFPWPSFLGVSKSYGETAILSIYRAGMVCCMAEAERQRLFLFGARLSRKRGRSQARRRLYGGRKKRSFPRSLFFLIIRLNDCSASLPAAAKAAFSRRALGLPPGKAAGENLYFTIFFSFFHFF